MAQGARPETEGVDRGNAREVRDGYQSGLRALVEGLNRGGIARVNGSEGKRFESEFRPVFAQRITRTRPFLKRFVEGLG